MVVETVTVAPAPTVTVLVDAAPDGDAVLWPTKKATAPAATATTTTVPTKAAVPMALRRPLTERAQLGTRYRALASGSSAESDLLASVF